MKMLNLTGQVYGRLTVISRAPKKPRAFWNCICECGKVTIAAAGHLKSGHTRSCGCLHLETGKNNFIHGDSKVKNKEYRTWSHMLGRCQTPTDKAYRNYGGRGIIVCQRWMESYENFLFDMGRAPSKKHSIERIDVNGNYEPRNCKWATNAEQASNKRNSIRLSYGGVTKSVLQWATELKLNASLIKARLRYGWTIHEALMIRPLKLRRSINYYRKNGLIPTITTNDLNVLFQ